MQMNTNNINEWFFKKKTNTNNNSNNNNISNNDGTPEKATHYQGGVQPVELMQAILTPDEFKGFLKGNMIKYAYRAGKKAGESIQKDRTKYLVYAQWLKEYLETGKITI